MRTERTLARHTAAIRERFIDAAINGIARLAGNQWELDKMPEHLREQFLEFMEKITKKGGSTVPGEGTIHCTSREMSGGEVQMLVDEFLALSDEIDRLPSSKNESD